MNSREAVERLFIGITGASLAVNAWLMTSKLSDIDDSLKTVSNRIGDLREEQAAIKAEVHDHSKEIADILHSHHSTKDD